MFDIGWSELLVIAVVAIIVVGPKDLPKLMRSVGHYAGKLRRAAADFQRQFEEAMREAEVEEVKKAIESVRVDGPPLHQPVMLPKPEAAPQAEAAKPKSERKRSATKPKTGSPKTARRRRKPVEPAP
ncbi:MAG TPA: Sec-independent protein translocase protein TatB [Methyloceanibacter sp.]|nr:Sec-independent protein translocase protein TatB [Methyloceanibacter sp.]